MAEHYDIWITLDAEQRHKLFETGFVDFVSKDRVSGLDKRIVIQAE